MNKYFESYSFEVPGSGNSRTKYNFRGPAEYINKLKAKPIEVTNSYTVNGWTVQQIGYEDGTLKSKAERQQGVETLKIEKITPRKLAKFLKIEIEGDYNPYMPLADTISWVEVSDRQNRTNVEFTKIDSEAEQPYQKRFSNSSIISISEFLHDKEFEKIIKSVKLEGE